MPISDNDFLSWLSRDGENRAVLIEARYFLNGVQLTEYMSNAAFVSSANDTPAHTSYDDVVKSIPDFEIGLDAPAPSSNSMKISTKSSFGEVVISNENGSRDDWLARAWDGRKIDIFLGSPDWEKSDFRFFMSGIIEDIEPSSSGELTLIIREKDYLLDVPVQKNLIATGGEADKPKPLTFGQVFNIDAVLIDEPTHKYQVHDGAIEAIPTVRDSGLSITVTRQLADGTFTLTSAPSGRITCDVQGDKNPTYLTTASQLVKRIVLMSTELQASDLDTAAFDLLHTECPQLLGVHYGTSAVSAMDSITDILASVGAYWFFTRNGLLSVKRFINPVNQIPLLSVGTDDIAQGTFKATQRNKPVKRIGVGYKRNYSVQNDGLAGAVGESARQSFGTEYLNASEENTVIGTAHPLALVADELPSFLVNQADAQAEAARILDLFDGNSTIYQFESFLIPQKLNLGDVIEIIYPRYGFDSGKNVLVIGLSLSPTQSLSEVTVWSPNS